MISLTSSSIRTRAKGYYSKLLFIQKKEKSTEKLQTMFQLVPVIHPTVDSKHPLLLLMAEHGDRYLFGKIPEGSQRACVDSKFKLNKVKNIFLTGEINWSTIGGLPGLILTISDQGKKNMVVTYGSNILSYVVSTWRYFVFRFGMNLSVDTLKHEESFKDSNISVKSFVISKNNTKGDCLPNDLVSKLKILISKMFPSKTLDSTQVLPEEPSLNVKLPLDLSMNQSSTSYEINFQSIRGKFNIDEAMKLKIPKGILYSRLTRGESITLDDGRIIEPHQVMHKRREFAKVLILDIPSNDYLPQFIKEFHGYNKEKLGAIYYFLGDCVTIDSNLINFMEQMNTCDVHHFISHSKVSPNDIIFNGAALTTLKLKAIDICNYNIPIIDRVFSKEFYDCFNKQLPLGTSLEQIQDDSPQTKINDAHVHIYKRKKNIHIYPYIPDEESLKIDIIEENDNNRTWEDLYNDKIKPLMIPGATFNNVIMTQLHVNNFDITNKNREVEVITFGTGSALPSKYRNVVSTLVKIPYENGNIASNRNILLDAGENTLGAIHRMFPDTYLSKFFQDLQLIYLSHLHADHHLGIPTILNEWYKYNEFNSDAILYLVAPWQYHKFLEEWFTLENKQILSKIKYISCEHLLDGSYLKKQTKLITLSNDTVIDQPSFKKRCLDLDDNSCIRDLKTINEMYKSLNMMLFQTCRAKHCDWSYSNSMTFFTKSDSRQLFKVSYSGDTRPNFNKFSNGIGYRSDLLIHEATFENDLIDDAIKKRHSTINEAIEVSNSMKAKKLILTHFSQRYPKAPQMSGNISIEAEEMCFAFDGMIVGYNTIGKQEKTISLLNDIFAEEKANANEVLAHRD